VNESHADPLLRAWADLHRGMCTISVSVRLQLPLVNSNWNGPILINITEIIDGTLVNAIAATGRMLASSASDAHSRRSGDDLDIARWFETYRITSELPTLPTISTVTAERLAVVLLGDEIQAALQELLAARLTDAPEMDAAAARQVFILTLIAADIDASSCADVLASYYDDQISDLVARLEGEDAKLLAQIRSEAFATRMINILNAIARHTAALSGRQDRRTEDSFLASYRRHVSDQHGKLEPPDFDRRRRVPIRDIYVPASVTRDDSLERAIGSRPVGRHSLDVIGLAGRLDRTVLLGNPGGGKTTAANVLMHYFASDKQYRIPFLVTLREYAAKDPPQYSVVGYVEYNLATFYQCPPPPGLVDLLLLTGRALVIFDGLDELLDTSRRADVTSRVERFCAEYPQAPMLVTSRAVGYDQARLDDRQFTCYRLGGFGEAQVTEYARKWFTQDPEVRSDEAESFLAESESVPDLRTNPLLLSLMCILYRGEGSLPRDRAGVYEQCATLLFRKWDARRRIHQDLRAGNLIEPTLRHLAWWLFTREQTQVAVTERELVAETTIFLHGRGFESEDDARGAASEFVQFCRGRMWVFSDAGTTSSGETLYSFTHRTFLEYFAAAQLAYDSDTPERLARTLASHLARGEWEVVGELAVQIKDNTSTSGAQRFYAELLAERRRRSPVGRSGILQFLARTLRSVDPSPQKIRALTTEVLTFLIADDPNESVYGLPVAWLLGSCGAYLAIVAEEISATIAAMIASNDLAIHKNGLQLAVSLDVPLRGSWGGRGPYLPHEDRLVRFWRERTAENAHAYAKDIIAAAADDFDMRYSALHYSIITVEQALQMRGSLLPLLQDQSARFFGLNWSPYLLNKLYALAHGWSGSSDSADLPSAAMRDLAAAGRYLLNNPEPPWIVGKVAGLVAYDWEAPANQDIKRSDLDPVTYLGGAGIALIAAESDDARPADVLKHDPSQLGPFTDLYAYMEHRHGEISRPLPELPMPDKFKELFHDWADGKVSFTA
jgi:hypothetical protein